MTSTPKSALEMTAAEYAAARHELLHGPAIRPYQERPQEAPQAGAAAGPTDGATDAANALAAPLTGAQAGTTASLAKAPAPTDHGRFGRSAMDLNDQEYAAAKAAILAGGGVAAPLR
jgi:hypothetical protein